MSFVVTRLTLLLTLLVSPASAEDLQSLVRQSLAFMNPATPRPEGTYLWRMRTTKKELDAAGKIQAENVTVVERTLLDGEPVLREIEIDGRKLSTEELRAQDARLLRSVAEARALTPAERARRERKEREENAWVMEIPEALTFRLQGERTVAGRPAHVIACSPKPGYSPKNLRARVFTKMNGTLLIDKVDRQLVQAEAETFDTVNVGFGIVGRIEKGTRFRLSRKRESTGDWLMREQHIRFNGRFLMLKHVGRELLMQWFDSRRPPSPALR